MDGPRVLDGDGAEEVARAEAGKDGVDQGAATQARGRGKPGGG